MFHLRGLLLMCGLTVVFGEKFQPTWDSLDKRPLPTWYDDAKFGIFVHWGVFSVPSFHSEWFWNYWKGGDPAIAKFMADNYPPKFTYQDFAKDFTAEFFNPDQWADIFESSGARYVVLTSKHHEGYCLWPSKYSYSWNSMDVGPKRDLLGELAAAVVKKKTLKFGLYHSLLEWYNPLFLKDVANNFTTQNFVNFKTMPELYELINTYHPEVLWSDGDWGADSQYWMSKTFLAWLYNESPVKSTIVVNDRWGTDATCKHGDFFNCRDNYSPGVLVPHKWENCMPVDKHSWGFRRPMSLPDVNSIEEILLGLVKTVSCGGNLLLNVGPTKEGTISPIFQERLSSVGKWLQVNGKGIYGSRPWVFQNDTISGDIWYTKDPKTGFVYAFSIGYPADGIIKLGAPAKSASNISVNVLGWPNPLKYNVTGGVLQVMLPPEHQIQTSWAYTLEIMGLKDISNEISVDPDTHFVNMNLK